MYVIYLKTAKAYEILHQTRSMLSIVQRRLLILVDGQKDVPTLIEKYGAFGMDQEALDDLAALGLLKRIAVPDAPEESPTDTMEEQFLRVQKQTGSAWALEQR